MAPPAVERFVARYWEAAPSGVAFHRAMPPLKQCAPGRTKRRPGHNRLERLKPSKDDVLRFLYDFTVPFANNLAEQDPRMMKAKMKISGGFRAFERASRFASLRSVVSTAQKRGWNILKTLVSQPQALIQALAAQHPASGVTLSVRDFCNSRSWAAIYWTEGKRILPVADPAVHDEVPRPCQIVGRSRFGVASGAPARTKPLRRGSTSDKRRTMVRRST